MKLSLPQRRRVPLHFFSRKIGLLLKRLNGEFSALIEKISIFLPRRAKNGATPLQNAQVCIKIKRNKRICT